MDAAKTRRRELAPRRVKRQVIAEAFRKNSLLFSPTEDNESAAEKINVDQIRSIRELHQTTPALRRCLESMLASVFDDRGLIIKTQKDDPVDLDPLHQLYIDEFWLEPLRTAASHLLMFGAVAVDVEPIGQAPTASAFLAVARENNTESYARKKSRMVVCKLEDVWLDFERGHYVEGRPAAVFVEQNPVDEMGNVSSTAASASNLYAFAASMAETTMNSWAVLSRPSIVTQARWRSALASKSDPDKCANSRDSLCVAGMVPRQKKATCSSLTARAEHFGPRTISKTRRVARG